METDKIEILKGPSKEKMERIYKAGGGKDVSFEIHYGFDRTAFVHILKIISVQETSVKMLASIPAGFFMYSQGEDPRPDIEKLQRVEVHLFYTTNTRKGYIEKIPIEAQPSQDRESRTCPRCKGRKIDPFYQSGCYRCGGVGTVYGPESSFRPSQFAD